jgi:DeoR/GlpR family transcriptional regulator of sugar metabolism
MADSTKLRRKSSMLVAALDKVTTLITDSRASPEEIETFKAEGVEVIVAEVSADDSILGRA